MTGQWCYGHDFSVNPVHPNWASKYTKPDYIATPILNSLRSKLIGYQ